MAARFLFKGAGSSSSIINYSTLYMQGMENWISIAAVCGPSFIQIDVSVSFTLENRRVFHKWPSQRSVGRKKSMSLEVKRIILL